MGVSLSALVLRLERLVVRGKAVVRSRESLGQVPVRRRLGAAPSRAAIAEKIVRLIHELETVASELMIERPAPGASEIREEIEPAPPNA